MLKTILVVEDEKDLRDYLKKLLTDDDYAVTVAEDGTRALELLHKSPPDLVVLDLGLPKVRGEAVLLEIKKNYPEIPTVILTAKSQSSDVVHAFELGTDDFVSKPFVGEELLARIKARFRAQGDEQDILEIDDLVLDNKTFEVKRGGTLIALTQTEFTLLRYLMANKGRVLSRDMILNKVWLYSPDIESRVVDVYIGYLRKKVDAGHKKKLIHSIRGFGYIIKD